MGKLRWGRVLAAVGTVLGLAAGNALAQKPDQGPGAIVFLNRGGGVYRGGFTNDSHTNSSTIFAGNRSVSRFAGDDADWETVLEHVRLMYKHFVVWIVDVEPPPTVRYVEAVVGGLPGQLGLDSSILGVAPVYCSPALNTIVFIFAAQIPGENIRIAEVISHEVGHAFSLD